MDSEPETANKSKRRPKAPVLQMDSEDSDEEPRTTAPAQLKLPAAPNVDFGFKLVSVESKSYFAHFCDRK